MEAKRQRVAAPHQRDRSHAAAPAPAPSPFSLLNLQESVGNQGLLGLLASGRLQAKLAVNQPGDVYEQEADRVAQAVVSAPAPPVVQRKCACGGAATSAGGECAECKKKREGLVQRSAVRESGPATAPPVVHDVLGSSGQPLDEATRAFLEPRFGRSFEDVRVYTGERAAEAAQSVDALAFTVGRDVVFGAGQYAPGTQAGQRLLAHELTHVVQQGAAHSQAGVLQRQPPPNPAPPTTATSKTTTTPTATPATTWSQKDEKAISIIRGAQDDKRDLGVRAVEAVYRIIHEYYPGEGSKVRLVSFDDKAAGKGLSTKSVLANGIYYGEISVGTYFIEAFKKPSNFARLVLQVGHELEHIDQHRSGMAGADRKDEREFLAFYHEALAVEKPATGRVQYTERVDLIDAAIGYYNCLANDPKQKTVAANHASKLPELQKRRQDEITTMTSKGYKNVPTKGAPTGCVKQP